MLEYKISQLDVSSFGLFSFCHSHPSFARKFWNSQSPRFVNIDAFTVFENDQQKFGERNWHDGWNLIWLISTDLSSKDDWSFVLGTLNYILISRSGKVCVSPTRQPEGGFLRSHQWSMLPGCPFHDYFMASYIVGAFFLIVFTSSWTYSLLLW